MSFGLASEVMDLNGRARGHPHRGAMIRRTAYELSESQVSTPPSVIRLFWQLAQQRRRKFTRVLDMGAGDCRFARSKVVDEYVGIELDKRRHAGAQLPLNGRLIEGCAFRHRGADYDACIGNPPYVRHHYIEQPWKERTLETLEQQLGLRLSKSCNLYLYFLCLGLLKTHSKGLVALVIPYEWVSRPSAKAIRDHIALNRWDVSVYRFTFPIFDKVLTTASISLIDKASSCGEWKYFDVFDDHQLVARPSVTTAPSGVLPYVRRGTVWALRGLSPGSQKIFTLTEGERIHAGLQLRDVVPCVTTLRHLSRDVRVLTAGVFRRQFVEAGQKCWLIRSFSDRRSERLNAYLDNVLAKDRDNYTCTHREPWFKFRPHPVPALIMGSGFTSYGPKVVVNRVGAHAVGAVFGIHSQGTVRASRLQRELLRVDFEKRVVAHAKTLKKVEVKQVNGVLNELLAAGRHNGRQTAP
jgi:hypothetical protein